MEEIEGLLGIEILEVIPVTSTEVKLIVTIIIVVILLVSLFIVYRKSKDIKDFYFKSVVVLLLGFMSGMGLYDTSVHKEKYVGVIKSEDFYIDSEEFIIVHQKDSKIVLEKQ